MSHEFAGISGDTILYIHLINVIPRSVPSRDRGLLPLFLRGDPLNCSRDFSYPSQTRFDCTPFRSACLRSGVKIPVFSRGE